MPERISIPKRSEGSSNANTSSKIEFDNLLQELDDLTSSPTSITSHQFLPQNLPTARPTDTLSTFTDFALHSGALLKLSPDGSWRRLYLLLTPTHLLTFSSKHPTEPLLETLDISTTSSIDDIQSIPGQDEAAYILTIAGDIPVTIAACPAIAPTVWKLRCSSRAHISAWHTAISNSLRRHPPSPPIHPIYPGTMVIPLARTSSIAGRHPHMRQPPLRRILSTMPPPLQIPTTITTPFPSPVSPVSYPRVQRGPMSAPLMSSLPPPSAPPPTAPLPPVPGAYRASMMTVEEAGVERRGTIGHLRSLSVAGQGIPYRVPVDRMMHT